MSTSGSSSSAFSSLMAADPEDEDIGYEGFDEKRGQMIDSAHEEEALPASVLRALQITAQEMQDDELSGIMEEKIKQYVLSPKDSEQQTNNFHDKRGQEQPLEEKKEHDNTPYPMEKLEEENAKCEQEILEYIRAQEQLESKQQAITDETGNPSSDHSTKMPIKSSPQHAKLPSQDPTPQQLATANLPDLPLEIGDHVYQWRSFVGIPGVFQHHGIVVDIGRDEQGEMDLKIADFSCILRAPNGKQHSISSDIQTERRSVDMLTGAKNSSERQRSGVHPHGIMRVYDSSSKDPKWRKVHYRASVWKTSLWRSGTCTCVDSDPPAKVLARAYFLLEHPELLPSYHIFNSNCECVAVWCKTGKWCTLQASSVLSLTAAGQLKSTATIAAYAASQQVTVQAPCTGLWGYLGYTTSTQVSLLSTQPHLIPMLAAYGVVTAGAPTFVLWKAQHMWERTSERLNDKFWEHACRDPDMFANSMMYWSEKHAAFERSR